MPMANRLNDTLDKAAFNYNDDEFNKDIEIIINADDYEEEKIEKTTIGKKISKQGRALCTVWKTDDCLRSDKFRSVCTN